MNIFQTHCDVNYVNWPWGEQNCTFTAGSWTYDMESVNPIPYLGSSEDQESPLDFEHLLDNTGVSIDWEGYTANILRLQSKGFPCVLFLPCNLHVHCKGIPFLPFNLHVHGKGIPFK